MKYRNQKNRIVKNLIRIYENLGVTVHQQGKNNLLFLPGASTAIGLIEMVATGIQIQYTTAFSDLEPQFPHYSHPDAFNPAQGCIGYRGITIWAQSALPEFLNLPENCFFWDEKSITIDLSKSLNNYLENYAYKFACN